MATRELILVSPERTADGEANVVHPLWDEIVAHAATADAVAVLKTKTLSAPRTVSTPPAIPLPSPRRRWSVAPELMMPRAAESASSIATLVGCSFRYVTSYVGQVHQGIVAPIAIEPRTLGITAHRLLEEFGHSDGFRSPSLMGAFFDQRAPRLNALLFLPGHDEERAQARRFVVRAAEVLGRQMPHGNLNVDATEQALDASVDGIGLRGSVDLVLKSDIGRRGVIDFKWGGAAGRRRELAAGASHQLAIYAHLVDPTAPDDVAVGYVILSDGLLLSPDKSFFDGAELVESRQSSRVWASVKAAVIMRRAEMSAGELEASANELGEGERLPDRALVRDDGRFVHPPGCEYCPHSSLCGLAWRSAR